MRWLDGISDSMDMSLSSSGRCCRTGKPGVLQSTGSQRIGHGWVAEQQELIMLSVGWLFTHFSPSRIQEQSNVATTSNFAAKQRSKEKSDGTTPTIKYTARVSHVPPTQNKTARKSHISPPGDQKMVTHKCLWSSTSYSFQSYNYMMVWVFRSVQFSFSVVSNSLWLHRLQHTRPPCKSPTPGVYPNSCPLNRWCHPMILSSVVFFSACLQSFPASGSFQMSQFFTSGGQSIGVSPSASVFPMNIHDWFCLGWTGWISLLSKGLSRVFSNITVQKHQFFKLNFL